MDVLVLLQPCRWLSHRCNRHGLLKLNIPLQLAQSHLGDAYPSSRFQHPTPPVVSLLLVYQSNTL